jgi:hypothetical protein
MNDETISLLLVKYPDLFPDYLNFGLRETFVEGVLYDGKKKKKSRTRLNKKKKKKK